MKVERSFNPITIVLETQEEADALWYYLNISRNHIAKHYSATENKYETETIKRVNDLTTKDIGYKMFVLFDEFHKPQHID